MNDGTRRRNGQGCGFLLLVAAGFAAMAYVMMERTGDAPYQATEPVNVHAGPDAAEPVLATLTRDAVLVCHGFLEADPRWLDCSDMLESRYVPAAAMKAIDEETYEALRRAQAVDPPAAR